MRRAILFRFALAAVLATSTFVVPAQSGPMPPPAGCRGRCVVDGNCASFICPFCIRQPGMLFGMCCASLVPGFCV